MLNNNSSAREFEEATMTFFENLFKAQRKLAESSLKASRMLENAEGSANTINESNYSKKTLSTPIGELMGKDRCHVCDGKGKIPYADGPDDYYFDVCNFCEGEGWI